ncbi:hypothetical protein D3C78_704620 [compost metagenome]
MTDTQLTGPLTDLSGRMGSDQHEMTVPALAYSFQYLKPLHVGQAEIEHYHVRSGALGFTDGTLAVVGNMDIQALLPQIILDIARKGLFVIDYQYCVNQGRLPEASQARFPGLTKCDLVEAYACFVPDRRRRFSLCYVVDSLRVDANGPSPLPQSRGPAGVLPLLMSPTLGVR